MKDKITGEIFSLSGLSIAIGTVGFLSGIVGIFFDVNAQLSVKWLFLAILIFVSLSLILLKIIYDFSLEKKPPPTFERPISYIKEEQVFVIRRNENFLNNIIVGCYSQHNEIDRLAYIGVVHLVQETVIQIKIRSDCGVLTEIPTLQGDLKNIVIRPVVPITALEQIVTAER